MQVIGPTILLVCFNSQTSTFLPVGGAIGSFFMSLFVSDVSEGFVVLCAFPAAVFETCAWAASHVKNPVIAIN